MDKLLAEMKSSRVWAVILYVAVIVANAAFDLGITDEVLGEVALVVGAFVVGKTLRGTFAGSVLKGLVSQANEMAEAHVPNVTESDKPDTD